jgi:aminocarboxymuconate-semialdehyde decarboxylase
MKIDIHTHILPENWPNLKEEFGYEGWVSIDHHHPGSAKMKKGDEVFRVVDSNCWDPKIRLKECDNDNIDVQVLSTVPIMFSYWAKANDALVLSKILNDNIAKAVNENPKRFIGLGTLPMQNPEIAIWELERCINQLGLHGIQIGSNINGKNLSDPSFFPVFEAASDLDASIFIHPWDIPGRNQIDEYWLPWLVGMPAETSRAICSLIFGGVFERLPKLRIAFAHGGGSFPATFGRIQHGFNVRPDLCATDNNIDPKEYLGKFWVDSLVHDMDSLELLIKKLGDKSIALGSDYPFPLGENKPGDLIESSHLSDEIKKNIFYRNALDWLNIKKEFFK